MSIFLPILKPKKIDSPVNPPRKLAAKSHRMPYKGLLYLIVGLAGNVGIWSGAIFYTKMIAPSYRSEWTVSIPGLKSSDNVNLPGIGQATSSVESPYNNKGADPRENYKFIARTDEVIELAASQLNMSPQNFGRPRVEILINTTFINFQMESDSPESAQEKAIALQTALDLRLQQLRRQEIAQQENNLNSTLSFAENKLQEAQARVFDYKSQSMLTENDQLRDISINLENLRRQRAEQVAELQQVGARLQQLSLDLGLSVQEASDAFTLQSDPIFQNYLRAYSQANADLLQLRLRFRPEHPAAIAKAEEWEATRAALLERSELLLGRPLLPQQLEKLNIEGSNSNVSERGKLLQQLIYLQTQNRGLNAQVQELDQQIVLSQARLSSLSVEKSNLDNIQRNVQIAEAVFSSMLTRLDLSQSNVSASYPPILLLTEPNLPHKPTAPKKLLLLATAMGSIFLTSGIFGLWYRDRRIHSNSPAD